jgi:hypothetical protein
MAGTSNHNVIVTLTGESTGIQKAAKSGVGCATVVLTHPYRLIYKPPTDLRLASSHAKDWGIVDLSERWRKLNLVAAQLRAEQERGSKGE